MSIFVFSRRYIQDCLDVLGEVLTADQLNSLVNRLNTLSADRLSPMWEAVLLRAFTTVGNLQHEKPLPNGRKPDFELEITTDAGRLELVGDITAVSDAGLDERNPVDTLHAEITRLARKFGLNANHLHYEVGGNTVGNYPKNSYVQLSLPGRGELQNLVATYVKPFVLHLSKTKPITASFDFDHKGVQFSITYDQRRRYGGGHYRSYGVAQSLTVNPIATRLKDKIDQLRGAAPNTIRAVLLCDGGCDLMQSSMRAPLCFDRKQIIEEALRKSSSIDLVMAVSVIQRGNTWETKAILQQEFFWNRRSTPHRLDAAKISVLERALREATSALPAPTATSQTAAYRCKQFEIGPDKIGGYKMSGTMVKLSSRALTRLLAGEISSEQFLKLHEWNTNSSRNPFGRMYREGRMIRSIGVEHGGDRDDDELKFEFGEPDPAAAPFVAKTGRIKDVS